MSELQAILLGIIEGFTEFLPISSTAHLVLGAHILRLSQSDFVKSFEIAIQAGAILSVAILYWERFLNIELLKKLCIAFIPTGSIGFFLYPFIKGHLIGNLSVTLWALLIGGVILIVFDRFYHESANGSSVSYAQAFAVGLFQSLAVIPGISRAGATIIGGLTIGIPRRAIVEFSFLLAVPTMAAATGYDLWKNASLFSTAELDLLIIGFVFSFITALFAVRLFLRFIAAHILAVFGLYRIAIAIIFFFLVY